MSIVAQSDNAPNTYDWLSFAVTAVAAIGTLGAVAVALFGPGWLAARREPRLTITAAEVRAKGPVMEGFPPSDAFHLSVDNERGRDTARDVEVFVTASVRPSEGYSIEQDEGGLPAFQQNLNFDNPLRGQYGSRQASVPSGFSRRLHFAVVGAAQAIQDAHFQAVSPEVAQRKMVYPSQAALSLFPARNDSIAFMIENEVYDIELVVVGSNFDALTFTGAVRYSVDREPYEAPAVIEWVAEPSVANGRQRAATARP